MNLTFNEDMSGEQIIDNGSSVSAKNFTYNIDKNQLSLYVDGDLLWDFTSYGIDGNKLVLENETRSITFERVD